MARRKLRVLLAVVAAALIVAVAGVLFLRAYASNDRIKAAIEAQAESSLGAPVRIGRLATTVFPRPGLTFEDIVVGTPPSSATIDTLTLSTGLRPLFSRRVADATIILEGGRLDAVAMLAVLTARPGAPATDTPAAAQFVVENIRTIRLDDVELVAGERRVRVNAELAYQGSQLLLQRMEAHAPFTEFTATGALTDLDARAGRFTIAASTLDLDGLLEFASAAAPQASNGGTAHTDREAHLDVVVDITAKQGQVFGATFADLATTLTLGPSRIGLEPLRLGLFGGRFEGAASVVLVSPEPRHRWNGALSNLDLAQVVAFAGAPESISGRLSATVGLAASGTSPAQALGSVKGSADIVASDGVVPGLEVVRTVVLAFGHPTGDRPEGSGERFTRLAATVAINGGGARTSNLTFQSRDFDMVGQGTLGLHSQTVNLDVSIVLSKELSAQAGRDLYRYARQNDRIVLPGRVTGSVMNPTVTIDLQQALKRALENTLKDKAKSLLERIIKR